MSFGKFVGGVLLTSGFSSPEMSELIFWLSLAHKTYDLLLNFLHSLNAHSRYLNRDDTTAWYHYIWR